MIRTQIYLPKSQLDKLRQKARRENATVSHVIRIMIGMNFPNSKPFETNRAETLLEAADRIGKLVDPDTPKDLARRMDHYLYERV